MPHSGRRRMAPSGQPVAHHGPAGQPHGHRLPGVPRVRSRLGRGRRAAAGADHRAVPGVQPATSGLVAAGRTAAGSAAQGPRKAADRHGGRPLVLGGGRTTPSRSTVTCDARRFRHRATTRLCRPTSRRTCTGRSTGFTPCGRRTSSTATAPGPSSSTRAPRPGGRDRPHAGPSVPDRRRTGRRRAPGRPGGADSAGSRASTGRAAPTGRQRTWRIHGRADGLSARRGGPRGGVRNRDGRDLPGAQRHS